MCFAFEGMGRGGGYLIHFPVILCGISSAAGDVPPGNTKDDTLHLSSAVCPFNSFNGSSSPFFCLISRLRF